MADLNFYNHNDFIAYPLVNGDDMSLVPAGSSSSSSSSGSGLELPRRGLVDAGFMLGLDSEFLADEHDITLYGVDILADRTRFDFRCDAPGMTDYRWVFEFETGAPSGCTSHVDATHITTGVPDADRGWGFLTVGDLEEIRALGVGSYLLGTPPRVEQALLQSLVGTFARTLNLANDPRRCPDECCQSSSSSSSSSSASGDDAFLHTAGVIGDARFKEGNNSVIGVNESTNTITFDAAIGSGEGETCEDIIIDEGGFQRGNDCINCDDLIKSINGRTTSNGKLRFIAGPTVVVETDPDNHLIGVTLEADKICAGSSSASP